MYISKINIQNFRCFKEKTIIFNDGLNVLIGENNAGKTTVLRALRLIFDNNISGISIEDFCKKISDFNKPPEIKISVTIKGSQKDSKNDKAVVASWLTKLSDPWEATITYRFFLSEKEKEEFKQENNNEEIYWDLVNKYLPKYVVRIYGGKPEAKNSVKNEWINRFDCQFLDAIRDVEREMFSGKNPLLKNILNVLLDNASSEEEINEHIEKFREGSEELINLLHKRLDRKAILKMAKEVGADFGGAPDISGNLDENDLIRALNLVIRDGEFEIPANLNGLGYNNLIYISMVLAKMEINRSEEYYRENASLFPMLIIEEPEAHLHPTLQFKFLKFLQDSIDEDTIGKQIFVTTHSTHITAAVDLNSIICLTAPNKQDIRVAYPGNIFNKEDRDSKDYIERFLDATKSNLFFARGIIFVEGIAEQLLIPVLAEQLNKNITDNYISVINVGGSTFKHFIKLFGAGIDNSLKKFAINRKVACIVDTDPQKKNSDSYKKCWPYELYLDNQNENYKKYSSVLENLLEKETDNVRIFYRKEKGKTFEYDLAFSNPRCDKLVTDSCSYQNSVSKIMNNYNNYEDISQFECEDEFVECLKRSDWSKEDKKRALVASKYLNSISRNKGEHAFKLQNKIRKLSDDEKSIFKVPDYIKNAIEWVCGG